MVRTGVYGYLDFGYESSFGGDINPKTKVFGMEQKLSGITTSVNRMALAQLNSPEPVAFAYGRNEYRATVDFILSNPWWFDALFGTPTSSGSAPTTWTWASNVAAAKSAKSLGVDIGFAGETANNIRTAVGAVVPSATIRTSLNDVVRCSADLLWGKELAVNTNSFNATPPTDDIGFPYTFVHGSLNIGGAIAQLQDMDINMNFGTELLYAINSPNAVGAYKKLMEITGRFNVAQVDGSRLKFVVDNSVSAPTYGRTTQGSLVMTFDNSLVGANQKTITITGTTVGFSDHSNNLSPNDPVFEDLSWQILSLNIQAKNNDVSEP